MRVEWNFKGREFIDGFGLCSPCRWHPWNRGVNRPESSKQLAINTYNFLESVVVAELGDVRAMAFKLVTGKLDSSPFPAVALDRARKRLAELVGAALAVDEGQPFFLRLLASWLRCYEGPDVSVLVDDQFCFSTGVHVGEDRPLPRTPQVFPPKDKQKKLDESDFNRSLTTTALPSCRPPSWRLSSERRKVWGGCFLANCRFSRKSMVTDFVLLL